MKAIQLQPDYGIAHRHLTSMITYSDKDNSHLKEMEYIHNQELINSEDKMYSM